MKKIICLLFAASTFVSCVGDDTNPFAAAPQVPVIDKATVVEGLSTNVYEFTYDETLRIKTIKRDGNVEADLLYTIIYDGSNRIKRVDATGNGGYVIEFLYDGAGKLNAYIRNEEDSETEIDYDAVTNAYSMPSYEFSFFFNSDLKRVNDHLYHYVGDKKGPMGNVNADYHFLGLFLDDNLMYFASKKPIDYYGTIHAPEEFSFNNTYNAGGYWETGSIPSVVSVSMEYVIRSVLIP